MVWVSAGGPERARRTIEVAEGELPPLSAVLSETLIIVLVCSLPPDSISRTIMLPLYFVSSRSEPEADCFTLRVTSDRKELP